MKKNIFKLLTVLLALTLVVQNVYADKIAQAGDTIVQEGDYNSTRFVAGNKVTNKANIDGISFVAGNDLTLEGRAPYGFFAGNNIIINEKIDKDLFVAGNNIVVESDAIIGRDVYIAGSKVTIKSNITGDLRVGAGTVDISGIIIQGNAHISAEKIILDENTIINGKLTYYDDSTVKGLDNATINEVKVKKSKEIETKMTTKSKVYDFLFGVISAFVTVTILFYLLPKTKDKLEKLDLSFGMIAKTACTGLVVLIVAPIIIFMAMITGFLTPVSLIVLAIYIIAIYLSSLLVSYVIGRTINEKLIHNKSIYLSLIIGIVLVRLVKLIPYLGFYVGAVIIWYGLGLIFNYILSARKK